jgi:Lrp/AsnC family transcriptional regulator
MNPSLDTHRTQRSPARRAEAQLETGSKLRDEDSNGSSLRSMDRIDRRILLELQRDATLSLARLADRVGLTQTPCWKRVQKLEQLGVIIRRVALVDPQKTGLGLTAFVAITVSEHSSTWRESFVEATSRMSEVVEVWRVAGEADYLLKVVTKDMATFDAFYRRLTERVALKSVTSQFAMERVAYTTALPINPDGP